MAEFYDGPKRQRGLVPVLDKNTNQWGFCKILEVKKK